MIGVKDCDCEEYCKPQFSYDNGYLINCLQKPLKMTEKIDFNNCDNFKSVKEGITQSTKQSGYSVYIPEDAKKQEETTTWDDIFEEYFQNYKEKYDMDIWLKEHYNVPIKKK